MSQRSIRILFLCLVTFMFVIVFSLNARQTVPISNTHQLQNGISLGLGLWAEPDPTLAGQATVVCAGSGGMQACITANNLIAADAQNRGNAFMKDIYKNYLNAENGLANNHLWFKPQ